MWKDAKRKTIATGTEDQKSGEKIGGIRVNRKYDHQVIIFEQRWLLIVHV